jgi:subtilase-type serine protease
MTAVIDQISSRKKFLHYIFNNNYINLKMIRCPTGALLKLTLQICGACIVFSGCSENGPVIAHIPEITPAPGDSPSNTIADGYSDEYATQYGLVLIKAVTLNNQGYTGKGVRVAVVDTGIDHAHSEFKGRQILGTNFGNDARGIGYDSDGHGTHVASIIGANRNAFGMRGVAYDVSLYDYRVGPNNSEGYLPGLASDRQVSTVFRQAITDNINIINNSWGSETLVTSLTANQVNLYYKNSIAAAQAAQKNGTLFVFAAGNERQNQVDIWAGLPYHASELAGSWLIVVAINDTNTEAYYTNRCGVAQAFCVTAPGSSVKAAMANTGNKHITYSGTSMATPHVSGIAAVLMQKFPSLSASAIATRIKQTASVADLIGKNGETIETHGMQVMRAIFGHGLINQTQASAQIGTLTIATGKNFFDGGSGIDITQHRLRLPKGLPSAVTRQILSDSFIAFDSFDGANFEVRGDEIFPQSNASEPRRVLGYGNHKSQSSKRSSQDDIIGSVAFGQNNENRLSLTEETIGNTLVGRDFWDEKAGLIGQPDLFDNTSTHQFKLKAQISRQLSFETFFQLINQTDGSDPGHGATLLIQATPHLKLHATVSRWALPLKLITTGSGNVIAPDLSTTVSFGLRHQYTDNIEIFANMAQFNLADVHSTPQSFGLTSAVYRSHTLGVELSAHDGHRLSMGISDTGSMVAGDLTLMAATSRSTDGTVHYAEKSYSGFRSSSYLENMVFFMSATVPVKQTGNSQLSLDISLQSGFDRQGAPTQLGFKMSYVF